MTKKTIKSSDVLGNNYYIYELSSSNYTPALNGTITITCTVTNVYGDPIGSKSITLYKNGTSVSTKTTNSSGVTTWSVTCSNAGIQSFKVENKTIEVFVDNKSDTGHTHTTTDITNLSIPSASNTTPSADTTSGSVGTGTTWARSNHTHPKSSLYAESSHNHTKSQITDFPTIPSKTSELTNDSGFLTSHQSLSDYLQTSDVKDNLTSTDTNKPLSANQGKELKSLIDNKEDNIETIIGEFKSGLRYLKVYSSSPSIENKLMLYKIPTFGSTLLSEYVTLDFYANNQTVQYKRKDIYKNGIQITFNDVGSNSWLLLSYEGTENDGQWNLISSSSYAEANHTHSDYANPTIADNLTTDDSTQVLSAKQGKILNDQIGNILTFFNGGQ